MSDRQAVECVLRRPGVAHQRGRRVRVGGGPVLSMLGVTAAAVGISAVQVREARRRYQNRAIYPGAVELTVVPQDPTLADGKPVELLALGDSGMAGVGVTQPAETLPALIAQRVAASTGRPVHVVSHAQAGARTHDVLVDQLALDVGRPDVVLLLIGTNDVTHLSRTRQLADDTALLLSRLHNVGAPVVMSSLPEFAAMRAVPLLFRVALRTRAVQVGRVQRRAVLEAGSGVSFVDVKGPLGPEFVTDLSLVSPDRYHPSRDGYARIADVLAPAVCVALTPRTDSRVGSDPSLVSLGRAG
jgi:lysophospholipase L1-like esterase